MMAMKPNVFEEFRKLLELKGRGISTALIRNKILNISETQTN